MRIEMVKAEKEFRSDERKRTQNDVELSAVG